MPYNFVSRSPSDWHEPDPHGWLYSAAFIELTDAQMPKIAEFVNQAYEAGLSVAQITFSGAVMKLYLDFSECDKQRGRDRIDLACDLFDSLASKVPMRDAVFHHGVIGDGESLELAASAEIFAPYGPQRPVDPDAPEWAPNEALTAILGF